MLKQFEFLDLKFNKFITLPVLSVIYAVALLIGLATVGLSILSGMYFLFTDGFSLATVSALVVYPIIATLFVFFTRLWLEFFAAIFRIARNSTALVEATQPQDVALSA
jgi:hypothetical protein